ncbi:hypothetical protein GCM10022243_30030 [Saccharothrix violaceirubra]|uniref:PLA2c domain-containing protein n=1 Tax=Saccharothrix violaceirubra TaxID=413306 RepID=A0A7W7T610_9PSEU|nr:hypothetical protein [Saccharothrix violaceirubra]MBB4966627.1 hypothetical protein [Saccharothrix violaceirubra]
MPIAPRPRGDAPGVAAEYVAEPPEGLRIGIALSGGGVRSAAFNLGAVQALRERGVLDNAEYLAAVSGGNYVASALAISAARSDPVLENGKPLWGRGSPEERYLRRHTDYLAPGLVGKLWLVAGVVYGFVLNYLPFVLSAVVLGRVAGWGLAALGVRLSDLRLNGLSMPASPVLVGLLLVGAAAFVGALLLVLYRRWFKNDNPGDYGESLSEKAASALLITTGVVVTALALPPAAQLYGVASRTVLAWVFGEPAERFGTLTGRLVVAFVWLVVSLLSASVALVLSRRFRARRSMLVLSSAAGAGLLFVPLLSSLEHSTRTGLRSPSDAVGVGVMLAVLLAMAVFVHNRRYSMHLFYRERLNSAFALERRVDDRGRVVAAPIAFHERLYFSDLEPVTKVPKLVVCCAVNLASDVPVGRFAESFTFERDVSGGPLFGYRSTAEVEQRGGLPGTQLTLPSIMAVSGAALSPMMGRFTYPPLRFLMALTNVRLGVWIRNPLHPAWREPRTPPRTALGRLVAMVRNGWLEPGAWYVLREAIGAARAKHRYIHLTDGGHWENLGLVELLRRRCTHVLCFDASGNGGLDIGRAMALARSELGVDIDLDPGPVLSDEDGVSREMTAAGEVRYPSSGEERGQIVYAKAVLTPSATWDLHAFKEREPRFPNHSTGRQMFTDEQFEAYRTLGYRAGLEACERLNIPHRVLRP